MIKQLGASFTVKGYLLMLLIAAGAASGAGNVWMGMHHNIVLEISCRPVPHRHAVYPSEKI